MKLMQPWHNNGCIVGAWFENHCCDGWNDFLAVAPAYSKSMLHVQQSHIGWSRWWHTVLAGCSWVKKQQWLQNHTWWFTALSKLVIYNPNIPQVYVCIYIAGLNLLTLLITSTTWRQGSTALNSGGRAGAVRFRGSSRKLVRFWFQKNTVGVFENEVYP